MVSYQIICIQQLTTGKKNREDAVDSLEEELVNQIRATARIESDSKLDTLARFTLGVILQKAKLTEAQLNAFFAAGYTQEQAIDVVLGVSLATLCNYVNNLAETPINPELQPFA